MELSQWALPQTIGGSVRAGWRLASARSHVAQPPSPIVRRLKPTISPRARRAASGARVIARQARAGSLHHCVFFIDPFDDAFRCDGEQLREMASRGTPPVMRWWTPGRVPVTFQPVEQ
jgi:hypothetical protein